MPCVAQADDQILHLPGLQHAQRRRGLVEDEEPGPLDDRLRHRHQLTLPPGQRADEPRRVADRDSQIREQRCRGRVEPGLGERQSPGLLSEQDIAGHIEVVAELVVLPDERDPLATGAAGANRNRPARQPDLAAGRRYVSGDTPDQRRLAGAGLAGQRDQFAGSDVQVDVGERTPGPKARAEPGHAQQRGRRFCVSVRESSVHDQRWAAARRSLALGGHVRRAVPQVTAAEF